MQFNRFACLSFCIALFGHITLHYFVNDTFSSLTQPLVVDDNEKFHALMVESKNSAQRSNAAKQPIGGLAVIKKSA